MLQIRLCRGRYPMAIDPIRTPNTALQAGPGVQVSRSSREAGAERLGELVRARERVAAELETPGPSQSERTVLTARLNDLQRQVNQLDGIVAGEGQESGGATHAPRAADVERVTPHSTESDQAAQVQGTPAAGSAPAGTSPASTGSTAVGATQDDSTQDVATQLDVVA